MKPEVIAFYLPQYHPTVHNNEWWGEGFTEWTNVAKAKPLFPGHYQPKVPADLGFYDLRIPEIRKKQAELAKEAGVSGFCYYHYWFGDGHEELELPFKEVVESNEPDFPFCLCWANESWHKKFWNKDGTMGEGSKMLAEQKYLGDSDNEKHFYHLIKAFKDPRYIKVNGKLLFMIYKPLAFDNVDRLINKWNKLAKENGLDGFHFVGYTLNIEAEYEKIKDLGFDAVCSCRLGYGGASFLNTAMRKVVNIFTKVPLIFQYKNIINKLVGEKERQEDIYPTMLPNWDHTPRSGNRGYLYHNSTPYLFEKHAIDVLNHIKHKKEDNQIIFLKSWNEWGEGNYMEPDLKFGKGFIKALFNALNKYNS